MSAKHHYGLTGRCDWSNERTFLYHKAEVVRTLKEQITNNPDNPGDWSLSVIIFLTWMEVTTSAFNGDIRQQLIPDDRVSIKIPMPQRST